MKKTLHWKKDRNILRKRNWLYNCACVYIFPPYTYICAYVHTIREADKNTENGFSESVRNCAILVEKAIKSFGMENTLHKGSYRHHWKESHSFHTLAWVTTYLYVALKCGFEMWAYQYFSNSLSLFSAAWTQSFFLLNFVET